MKSTKDIALCVAALAFVGVSTAPAQLLTQNHVTYMIQNNTAAPRGSIELHFDPAAASDVVLEKRRRSCHVRRGRVARMAPGKVQGWKLEPGATIPRRGVACAFGRAREGAGAASDPDFVPIGKIGSTEPPAGSRPGPAGPIYSRSGRRTSFSSWEGTKSAGRVASVPDRA